MNKLKQTYLPGLDGIRAFAIFSVFAYHLNYQWAKGGFIGVDVFFVLSGYLITSSLLAQWQKKQTIDYKRFLYGRFKRLIPAAYFMIIVVVAFSFIFKQELLPTLRGDAIASLFYSSNWWFIFHNVSYFDSFGAGSPLKNLWSLAIEEQFYLLWPLVFIVLLKLCKSKKQLVYMILSLAMVSVILMAVLYVPGSDPSRVYYGTDTRYFALLFGAVLAIVWPMAKMRPDVPQHETRTLNIIGAVAFSLLVVWSIVLSEFSAFLYYGGFLLITLISLILIAVTAHPSSIWSKILGIKPLRYIGSRSYGIYLWHYPIIILTTPITAVGTTSLLRTVLQVGATLIIAEFSYRLIENPIRKNGFKEVFQWLSFKNFKQKSPIKKTKKIIFVAVIMVFSLALGNVNALFEQKQPEHIEQVKIKPKKAVTPAHKNFVGEEKKPNANKIHYKRYLAIGDSLMIDVSKKMEENFQPSAIDGAIGRQMKDVPIVANSYLEYNTPDSAVILALGTNGNFKEEDLQAFLTLFSKAHIYLVNTRVPRAWEQVVNDTLKKAATENKNITLVDWHATAVNHPEYFSEDGVHLNTAGVNAYIKLLSGYLTPSETT